MNLASIIATLAEVGSGLPAYKALFDQVVGAFSDSDQAELKAAYDRAMASSDAAHRDAQSL